MIILHYTGMQSAEAALERLCDKDAQVSAHYVVDEAGGVFLLVDDEKRAWHAGKSFWAGEGDINSASIGIEIVNGGHQLGYEDFSDRQMTSVRLLCAQIIECYTIPASRILAHSDVAPSRKIDPGEKFPWQDLADHGIGSWPQPNEYDYQSAQDILLDLPRFYECLGVYGYDMGVSKDVLVSAYHRHFYPEKFMGEGDPKDVDLSSVAKLLALLRQAKENG